MLNYRNQKLNQQKQFDSSKLAKEYVANNENKGKIEENKGKKEEYMKVLAGYVKNRKVGFNIS